jgi:phage shock protein C
MSNEKRLYRSRDDRKIAGVCAGLGKYFNVDPTIMRLIFVLAAIFTAVGPAVLIYILLVVIIPEEP